MPSSTAIVANALCLRLVSLVGVGGLSLPRKTELVHNPCTDVLRDVSSRSSPCFVTLSRMHQAGFTSEQIRNMQQNLYDIKADGCPRPCPPGSAVVDLVDDSLPPQVASKDGAANKSTNLQAVARPTKNTHAQALTRTTNELTLDSNPCTDPAYPFAAIVAGSVYCFLTHHTAAEADNGDPMVCGSWCRLNAADSHMGCANVIECQAAAATPAPTASWLRISFKGSTVTQNNLGHLGPALNLYPLARAQPLIRYKNIGRGDSGIDLVIANLSEYRSDNSSRNGITEDGNFGRLHFTCGTNVTLRFGFEDTETRKAVSLKKFYFTIADLDQGIFGRCKETVQVMGYTDYSLSDTTEVRVLDRQGAKIFRASTHGHEDDNPTSLTFTRQQENRAVGFVFEDCQSFTVTVSLEGHEGGYGGRNILFAGESSLTPPN